MLHLGCNLTRTIAHPNSVSHTASDSDDVMFLTLFHVHFHIKRAIFNEFVKI
jgi:hypothetical protein